MKCLSIYLFSAVVLLTIHNLIFADKDNDGEPITSRFQNMKNDTRVKENRKETSILRRKLLVVIPTNKNIEAQNYADDYLCTTGSKIGHRGDRALVYDCKTNVSNSENSFQVSKNNTAKPVRKKCGKFRKGGCKPKKSQQRRTTDSNNGRYYRAVTEDCKKQKRKKRPLDYDDENDDDQGADYGDDEQGDTDIDNIANDFDEDEDDVDYGDDEQDDTDKDDDTNDFDEDEDNADYGDDEQGDTGINDDANDFDEDEDDDNDYTDLDGITDLDDDDNGYDDLNDIADLDDDNSYSDLDDITDLDDDNNYDNDIYNVNDKKEKGKRRRPSNTVDDLLEMKSTTSVDYELDYTDEADDYNEEGNELDDNEYYKNEGRNNDDNEDGLGGVPEDYNYDDDEDDLGGELEYDGGEYSDLKRGGGGSRTQGTEIPGGLGKYFVYVNCTTCKIKSQLVVLGGNKKTTKRENDRRPTRETTRKTRIKVA